MLGNGQPARCGSLAGFKGREARVVMPECMNWIFTVSIFKCRTSHEQTRDDGQVPQFHDLQSLSG